MRGLVSLVLLSGVAAMIPLPAHARKGEARLPMAHMPVAAAAALTVAFASRAMAPAGPTAEAGKAKPAPSRAPLACTRVGVRMLC